MSDALAEPRSIAEDAAGDVEIAAGAGLAHHAGETDVAAGCADRSAVVVVPSEAAAGRSGIAVIGS